MYDRYILFYYSIDQQTNRNGLHQVSHSSVPTDDPHILPDFQKTVDRYPEHWNFPFRKHKSIISTVLFPIGFPPSAGWKDAKSHCF